MQGLGIDIGGSKIAVSASSAGLLLFSHAVALDATQSPAQVMAPLLDYLHAKIALHGPFCTIAIASAPNIDQHGRVSRWPNHPHWDGTPVVATFAPLATDAVLWCDDGTAATIGDAHVLSTDGLVHLSLGTGVGGGVLFENRILRDRELGHLLVRADGLPCSCGRSGCLQAYASSRSLERHVRVGTADEAAWLAEATDMVAACIANLVELFLTKVVTLSGGLCQRFPQFGDMVSVQLRKRYLKFPLLEPEVMHSPHGANASLQGALILASTTTPHRTVCHKLPLR